MYRRMFGAGAGGASTCDDLPRALQNKSKYGRRRRHSAPALRTLHIYGPPKNKDRCRLDKKILKKRFPQFANDMEKKEKEKEQEEEEARIPEKELEKLPVLKVKKVLFHTLGKKGAGDCQKTVGNAKNHHTSEYACSKTKDGQPVLRRGQEFKITITFSRPYNKAQDDLSLIMEADENPGKNLKVDFKLDEERRKPFADSQHWAARIKKMNPEKCTMKLAVYIPGKCVVGEWDLKVRTTLMGDPQTYVYAHPQPFIVLFNPWSVDDQVHYTEDKADLKEYILNSKGTAYVGSSNYVRSKPWIYGQFDKDILQVSLTLLRQAFGFKMTPAMADPLMVSRALSRIVNSVGDSGVLEGNWSGNYDGGTSPTQWDSSAVILHQFADTGAPVKYGQCWVFSHVLTAVCRALGLPCRSVTNFDSAHDTDNSCTIDCYFDESGTELKHMKTDSIWNFHVWNEVWILRPDIEEHDCHGWHVIDATPQEQSDGIYQCGPSPLKAIKNGYINIPFDTGFIFSEVNADVVHWVCSDDGEFTPSAVKKNSVGSRISTKPVDGKPHLENLSFWNMDDPKLRKDLTREYKHEEGTEEERQAVKRAVRSTFRGADLYLESAALEVSIEEKTNVMVGEDLTVTAVVKNLTQESKEVDIVLSARTSSYWDDPGKTKELCKEKIGVKTFRPGAEEKFKITVPSSVYVQECDESMAVYVYALGRDVKKKMPHSAQQPFSLGLPDLKVEGPARSKPQEVVALKVTITNPLDKPLTGCRITTKGDLYQADDDKNRFETFLWQHLLEHRDLKAKETVSLTFKMYWEEVEEEEDEEEETDDEEEGEEATEAEPEQEPKSQSFEFSCRELASMTGCINIECNKP